MPARNSVAKQRRSWKYTGLSNYQLTCLYAHAWPVSRRYLNSRETTMLSWFTELKRRRREKYAPRTMRSFVYYSLCMLIFINASGILKDWLGFGSGRNFSDLQNILLSSFWAGGVCVFVVQILLWVEMAIRRFVKRWLDTSKNLKGYTHARFSDGSAIKITWLLGVWYCLSLFPTVLRHHVQAVSWGSWEKWKQKIGSVNLCVCARNSR